MPKARTLKKRARKVKTESKRIIILCEGEKTEPIYFEDLIGSANLPGYPIKVIPTKKNTPVELIQEAKEEKENHKLLEGDEMWVVFDRNTHPNIANAFTSARAARINIAFSSVSFEYWILLHFHYTSRQFTNDEEVIKWIHKKGFPEYEKKLPGIYLKIRDHNSIAFSGTKKIKAFHRSGSPRAKKYNLNPYTDVDVLVYKILNYPN